MALGQAQEGLSQLKEGLLVVRATGTVTGTPVVLIGLAAAYGKTGQPIEGLKCLVEAARIIETTEERGFEAEVYRMRGHLLNTAGDRAAAERKYHQALTVARRQSAKTLELRAVTSPARLGCDQGKRSEARDFLAPTYGWFTERHADPASG